MKLSFLIPAHNEESMIAGALDALLALPYQQWEAIIGLDGCTDGTEDIVKAYVIKDKRISYYSLNLRSGKPAVIDALIKKATGEIICIHDADWRMRVRDARHFKEFLKIFNDQRIGGIAESFPVEWDAQQLAQGNLGYKMVGYSSYGWLSFQKSRFSTPLTNSLRKVSQPTLFMTNIFRKSLYKMNRSLSDDFERTYLIMDAGYAVVLLSHEDMPRYVAGYTSLDVKKIFQQKMRTARARKQMSAHTQWNIGIGNYYFPAFFSMMRTSLKQGFMPWIYVLSWWMLTSVATAFAALRKGDTKRDWLLRAR